MREDQADKLIAVLTDLVTVMGGKAGTTGGGAGSGGTTTGGKPGSASKITFEMVRAALNAVKDEHGVPAAKKIIKVQGKAEEMAAIKAPAYAAVLAACKALMEPEGDQGEEDPGEDTL